jgi:hypothetical protein
MTHYTTFAASIRHVRGPTLEYIERHERGDERIRPVDDLA